MKFYTLVQNDFMIEKGYADTEYYKTDPTNFGNSLYCPKCNEILTEMKWLPPYQIELIMRTKQYGNIVFGAGTIDLIVDEYFKTCFEKTKISGLTFLDEIEITKILCYNGVRGKTLSVPPKYYVARMKYGSAAIDHKKSGSIFKLGEEPTCAFCLSGFIDCYPRIIIDESTWDGTDVFLARGIGGIVTVSQKFKDWWDLCNFNNGKVIPTEEYHQDYRH